MVKRNKEMKALIKRTYKEHQTEGRMYVFNDNNGVEFDCETLELKWLNNEVGVSCIPEGIYKVIKHISPRYKECFWIQDVEGRSEILIHDKVNFVGSKNPKTHKSDLRGCIAPYLKSMDIDGDGIKDIAPKSSTDALKKLLSILPDEFELVIEEA